MTLNFDLISINYNIDCYLVIVAPNNRCCFLAISIIKFGWKDRLWSDDNNDTVRLNRHEP